MTKIAVVPAQPGCLPAKNRNSSPPSILNEVLFQLPTSQAALVKPKDDNMRGAAAKPLLFALGSALLKSGAAAIGSAYSPTAVVKTWKLNSLLGQKPTLSSALGSFAPKRSVPHFKASFINCASLFIPHILAKEGLARTADVHKLGPKQQEALALTAATALCVSLYLGPSVAANNILLSGEKVGLQDLMKSKGSANFATTVASLFGREALDLAAFTWPKNPVVVNIATAGGAALDKVHSATSLIQSKPASLPAVGGFLLFRAMESRSLLIATQIILDTIARPDSPVAE